jgi:hypothetical protein
MDAFLTLAILSESLQVLGFSIKTALYMALAHQMCGENSALF